MKRTLLASALSVCLCLLIVTTWLLLNPITASAATCVAQCRNSDSVSCSGFSCSAADNFGCWYQETQESRTQWRMCKLNNDEL